MKVLSLFDGMACGMLAFKAAGLQVDRYVAYEIDKYAVQTSSHNFPMIEHKGDVFHADFTEYFDFDFLVGGSPCTYWSIAQKNNRETEASGMGWELFSQYVRALHEAKPKFFIYENNKSMSKAIRQSITETFGFEPICINSALVSAQNRQRLYWVGRRNEDNTYSQVLVSQPKDKGIVLRDILESGVVDREKAYPLLTTHQGNARDYFKKGHAQIVCEPVNACGDKSHTLKAQYFKNGIANFVTNSGYNATAVAEPVGIGYRGRTEDGKWVKRFECNGEPKANAITTAQTDSMVAEPVNITPDGKSQTIKAQYQQTSVVNICCYSSTYGASGVAEPIRVGCMPSPDGEVKNSQGMRVYSVDGKAVNQTAQGGGLGAKTGLYSLPVDYRYAIPVEFDQNGKPTKAVSGSDRKTYTVYEVRDGLITVNGKQYPIKLADGFYIIRKLTVTECKRLQTVPDWYEFPVSNAQAYKMLGNGWTVDVIAHLITSTQKENENGNDEIRYAQQLTFY